MFVKLLLWPKYHILLVPQTGRVDPQHPRVCGHSGRVLDVKWNPFDDHCIASCSEDCTVSRSWSYLWFISFCRWVHKTRLLCVNTGEDLGHPGLWRPTEPHQGQEDSDWSLKEGGAYWVAPDSWEPAAQLRLRLQGQTPHWSEFSSFNI